MKTFMAISLCLRIATAHTFHCLPFYHKMGGVHAYPLLSTHLRSLLLSYWWNWLLPNAAIGWSYEWTYSLLASLVVSSMHSLRYEVGFEASTL